MSTKDTASQTIAEQFNDADQFSPLNDFLRNRRVDLESREQSERYITASSEAIETLQLKSILKSKHENNSIKHRRQRKPIASQQMFARIPHIDICAMQLLELTKDLYERNKLQDDTFFLSHKDNSKTRGNSTVFNFHDTLSGKHLATMNFNNRRRDNMYNIRDFTKSTFSNSVGDSLHLFTDQSTKIKKSRGLKPSKKKLQNCVFDLKPNISLPFNSREKNAFYAKKPITNKTPSLSFSVINLMSNLSISEVSARNTANETLQKTGVMATSKR
jgi:hypothetical protein